MIDTRELKFTFARSSGPGGQNVNKVNSKAILRWDINLSHSVSWEVKIRLFKNFENKITNTGELVISCDQFRDQAKNRNACIEKLESYIASALEPEKKRHQTKPKFSQKRKRLEKKKKTSEKKIQRRSVRGDDF